MLKVAGVYSCFHFFFKVTKMLHFLGKKLPQGNRSLQTRFQIGLAVILCFFCLLSVVVVYTLQRNLLEREALRQANVVMSSLEATRRYVRETLRPRMYEILPENSFVIESMSSSYITRVIMQNLDEELSEFNYRRVAENPRNLDFAPRDLEQKMITHFRDKEGLDSWEGVVGHGASRQFIRFQPVRFNQSCLVCHGRPEDAPQGIIERYGDKGGFYKEAGEVGGVVSVSIPVGRDLIGIRTSVFWLFGCILTSSILLFIFIQLFFRQLVVVNLHNLLGFFRETVTDAKGSQIYERMAAQDEIKEMSEGMRLLATHIRDNKNQLEQHAFTLENIVAQRTEELERSHDQLARQMRQRNSELDLFIAISDLTSRAAALEEILNQVLLRARQVLPGKTIALYIRNNRGELELCCSNSPGKVPQIFRLSDTADPATLLSSDENNTAFESMVVIDEQQRSVTIPLSYRAKNHGIMLLSGLNRDHLSEPTKDLLLSIGNQIGIAIESIQNTNALRHSQQLLQSVINGISDPLVLLDNDGRLQIVNDAFLARHQLQHEESLGRKLTEIIGSKNCFIGQAAEQFTHQITKPLSQSVTTDDGSTFKVLFYPVFNHQGEVSSIICLAHDVTESERVQQKLRQTEKLAAIGQLAAGVAHEINNPLSIILCHTDIAKNEYSITEELREDIETIERHANNCRHTVTELLNFARTKDSQLLRQQNNINEAIRLVAAMVEVQFAKQYIDLILDLDRNEPHAFFDSDRIQQVLMNLLVNSAQAIGKDGTIRITSRSTSETMYIDIEDNGPGIPDEIKENIFDPFFTTKRQGTGLGLSVSYRIISDHNGDISVSSQPERTIFTIQLPRTSNS